MIPIGIFIYNFSDMSTFARNTVLFCMMLLSISSVTTSDNVTTYAWEVTQNKRIQWEYMIYLTHPTSKVTIMAKKWVEPKKIKILTLCTSLVKTMKNYGIKCTWNKNTIFNKQATVVRVRATSPIKPNTTPVVPVIPVVTTSETKLFEGYLDGRNVISLINVTQEKATETCNQMKSANPKSEISCRWGNAPLGTSLIQGDMTVFAVELIKSEWATGSYLGNNKEQEIGRFALRSNSGNTDTSIESIVITQNGSAGLRSLVDTDTSVRLIDLETGKEVSATTMISDKSISFTKMSEILVTNTTRHYKIVLMVNALRDIPDMLTIWLTLDPQNIKVIKKNDTSRILLQGWVVTMRSYVIGSLPPTVSITSINDNLFRIRITNPDENYGMTLSDLMFSSELTLLTNSSFTARACLRNIGSNWVCGTDGTSVATMPVPGSSMHISIPGSTMSPYVEKGNNYLDIDLYVYSDSIFPTGGQLSVTLDNLTYVINGKTFTERYPGLATARATYRQ